jgi:hypothetical protein
MADGPRPATYHCTQCTAGWPGGGYPPPGQYQPPGRWADPYGQHHDPRRVWVYPNAGGGSFSYAGDGRWVETNATGSFYFQEVTRTPEYVEIYDASRGASARLYDRESYHTGPDTPGWQPLYPGHWE